MLDSFILIRIPGLMPPGLGGRKQKQLKEKQTSTNKLETLFVKNKCTELLYYNCILQDCRLERQLLVEISIQYTLANISKSVFTTFVATNPLYWCHSANCVICKTESKRDLNIPNNPPFLRLQRVVLCVFLFVGCILCAFGSSPAVR